MSGLTLDLKSDMGSVFDSDEIKDVIIETCDACQTVSRQGAQCDYHNDCKQCPAIQIAVDEAESEMMFEAHVLGENHGI